MQPTARLWIVHPALDAPSLDAPSLDPPIAQPIGPPIAPPIEIGTAPRIIGRMPSGPLAHRTVSRRHLAIEWDPRLRRYVGEDLRSKNGTWIDGAALLSSRCALDDGSVIRLGETVAVIEIAAGAGPGDSDDVTRDAVPGVSAAVRRLRAQIAAAARDPAPVLLLGETGVGKERIAAEIHRLSGRTGPFCAVNCAELTAELVESQLFGHARGAFTGAMRDQLGLFRTAARGTLLLDEIGELPLALQPKLLRVLQEQEVLPVGEQHPVPIDVRVIAATNSDLPERVVSGGFRRDLYARLAFWEIRVPALRARRPDLMPWIARLYERWVQRRSDTLPSALDFEAAAVEAILLAPWPDNLRGLDRLVHRLAAEPRGPIASAELELPAAQPTATTATTATTTTTTTSTATNAVMNGKTAPRPKRPIPTPEELRAALEQHGGSIRAVARYFGRDRKQIYRWIKDRAP